MQAGRRRLILGLTFLAMAISVAACSDDDGRKSDASTSLSFEPVPLSVDQSTALSAFAEGDSPGATVPEKVGMVVDPQPADLSPGKLLVAVSYGNTCGRARVEQVRLKGSRLIVHVSDPTSDQPNVDCVGSGDYTGLRVDVPKGAAVKEVAVEAA
jgi:hypothetical protein